MLCGCGCGRHGASTIVQPIYILKRRFLIAIQTTTSFFTTVHHINHESVQENVPKVSRPFSCSTTVNSNKYPTGPMMTRRLSTLNQCHTSFLWKAGRATIVLTLPDPHTVARPPSKSPTSCTSSKLQGYSRPITAYRRNTPTITGRLVQTLKSARTCWPSSPIPLHRLRGSLAAGLERSL